jgi:hypothetical protein
MTPESAVAALAWAARARVVARKSHARDAEDWLVANRAPDTARRIFKAAVGASDSTMAPPQIRRIV